MLVTLADVKDYLGETTTNYDAFLTSQINLFSSAVENYCARKFLTDTYTQTFYYSDFDRDDERKKLWLYHFPVASIQEVREITTFDGSDSSEVIPTTDYRLNIQKGFITRTEDGYPKSWFNDSKYFLVSGLNTRVEVDFTAGYAETPLEIQDVIFSLIGERYAKKVSGVDLGFGNDIQRLSIPGTMSIDFDYSLQANERKTKFGMLLGNYINVLDFFRSERPLAGDIKENYVVES